MNTNKYFQAPAKSTCGSGPPRGDKIVVLLRVYDAMVVFNYLPLDCWNNKSMLIGRMISLRGGWVLWTRIEDDSAIVCLPCSWVPGGRYCDVTCYCKLHTPSPNQNEAHHSININFYVRTIKCYIKNMRWQNSHRLVFILIIFATLFFVGLIIRI